MVIALTPFGKFPMLPDVFIQGGLQMLAPWGHIKPIFPMPGGGTTQGHVQALMEWFGQDVMVAAGGAIHGHPMGPAAGAKAFRQAFDIVNAGGTLAENAKDHPELEEAIKMWGLPEDPRAGIFDLRS
jgi:2,3-diketo-5-methylthiopentyl-1-phosphate enolase